MNTYSLEELKNVKLSPKEEEERIKMIQVYQALCINRNALALNPEQFYLLRSIAQAADHAEAAVYELGCGNTEQARQLFLGADTTYRQFVQLVKDPSPSTLFH